MTRPAHLSPREIRWAQTLAYRTTLSPIEAELVLTQLQTSDELLAELMALSTRPTPPETANGPVLAFHDTSGWIIAPGGQPAYLPLPTIPE